VRGAAMTRNFGRVVSLTLLLAALAQAQGVFAKRVSPVNPTEVQSFQKQVKVGTDCGDI
jgi:hypothetical protein